MEIVAGTDHGSLGRDGAPTGLDPRRHDRPHGRLTKEGDAQRLLEVAGERRDRVPRLDPHLVQAPQGSGDRPLRQHWAELAGSLGLEQLATLAHLRFQESLEHGARLGAAGDHHEAPLLDPEAGLGRQLHPYIA
jgi:hypothetical protein